MKKKIETLLLAMIFIISSIMLIISCKTTGDNKKADSDKTTVSFEYTVKEFNGRVAVFEYGEILPFQILDCPISSLPQSEADKIITGIDIANEQQLQNLIEAYD